VRARNECDEAKVRARVAACALEPKRVHASFSEAVLVYTRSLACTCTVACTWWHIGRTRRPIDRCLLGTIVVLLARVALACRRARVCSSYLHDAHECTHRCECTSV
jgi:hypothetical protein